MIISCRIEEMIRFRETVGTTLRTLRKEWASFWDLLETSAAGHAWFLETKLRDLLDAAPAEDATTGDMDDSGDAERKRDHRGYPMGNRKRLRLVPRHERRNRHAHDVAAADQTPPTGLTCALSPIICIESTSSTATTGLDTADMEDTAASSFLSQLQQLSLRSQGASGTTHLPRNPTAPPSEAVTTACRTETYRALHASSSSHRVCGDTTQHSDHEKVRSVHEARAMLEKLATAWQTFRTIEDLRGLLLRFNLPSPHPPVPFAQLANDDLSTPPTYPIFRYPQVLPGIQPPLELLLSVECRFLQPDNT